jgi:hypothetical protein
MPEVEVKEQDQTKLLQAKAKEALFYLLKNWYLLILAIMAGGAIGYISIRKVQPTYTANFTFVLSTDQRPGGGGLANLASQLGVDNSGSGTDNIFSGDNIIELFKSRELIGSALLSVVDSASHQSMLNYIAQSHFPAAYKNLGPFNQFPKSYSAPKTKLYRRILTDVANSFVVFKKDKKLIFYVISATSTDPNMAFYIAKYMLDQTSNYFIDTKTKVAATTVRLLKHEADSLGGVIGGTFTSNAATLDRTFNLNPSISVQRSGLMFNQAKATAMATAYAEVMRNLEASKINLQKETPLYRIIDQPELPLLAIKESTVKHTLTTTAIALVLMMALLIADYFYKPASRVK